ncbi:hypothetical protein C486_03524 [Natrinema gari JCM 14663]|uniref:Uncharacterized protein n=1 Tax=Natrinema gari JCM 14663 TaxID=1230459 RepID=L9Z958_9EURY|nr:hypothetical protein C486_03524 [Natrinema gari JCM 14663]
MRYELPLDFTATTQQYQHSRTDDRTFSFEDDFY